MKGYYIAMATEDFKIPLDILKDWESKLMSEIAGKEIYSGPVVGCLFRPNDFDGAGNYEWRMSLYTKEDEEQA